MKLNYEQFVVHIKQHGITLAKTTCDFRDIPKGTKLYFGVDGDRISTFNFDTKDKNVKFKYTFEYRRCEFWINDNGNNPADYQGEFEVNELPDTYVIHCPTQELYNAIVDKIGWVYHNDISPKMRHDYWEVYREEFCVYIVDNQIRSYGKKHRAVDDHYKVIPATEVLGLKDVNIDYIGLAGMYAPYQYREKMKEKEFQYGKSLGDHCLRGTTYTNEKPKPIDWERFYHEVPPDWKLAHLTNFKAEYISNKLTKKSMLKKLSEVAYSVRKLWNEDEKALYRADYKTCTGKWSSKANQEAYDALVAKHLEDNVLDFIEKAKDEIKLAKEEKE